MTVMNAAMIEQVLNAQSQGFSDDLSECWAQGAQIDTRKLTSGNVFFALKGESVDGHDYLAAAHKAGAAVAIVERWMDAPLPQIKVSDVRIALGQLAAWWRQQLSGKVIAITGSNGKTTVKEMLQSIFNHCGRTTATQGNLNNDLGMPLSLLNAHQDDAFVVLEMGANHFGEIDYMTHIAQPDVALVNNAGPAHLEGFGDIAGVAKAKGEIYSGLVPSGVAVINADDAHASVWLALCENKPIQTFGFSSSGSNAKVRGQYDAEHSLIVIESAAGRIDVPLQLLGQHNANNALASAATALAAGATLTAVEKGLSEQSPVDGRMQTVFDEHGLMLINDAYNANPASLMAGCETLLSIANQQRSCVILGDLGELGGNSEQLHQQLGRDMRALGVGCLLTLGSQSALSAMAFGGQAQHFDDVSSLVDALQVNIDEQEGTLHVLVKGSRSSRMERVIDEIIKRFEGKALCCSG